ncbi:hypothetical protein PAMA_017367 [Pampus argenteus]
MMGNEQSARKKKGYKIEKETENSVVATKGDETFFIKKVSLNQQHGNAVSELMSEMHILKETKHPHIVSIKDSFKAEDQNIYCVVMDYCQGGSLDAKIKEGRVTPPNEDKTLSLFVEICMALRTIHEKGLLHKNLMPENVLLTEFGTVRFGILGKDYENSQNPQSTVHYLAPEVLTERTYDAKSDIWSVGCILYELCTGQLAFSAETTIRLIPEIIGGPCPSLPEGFSPELQALLNDTLYKDPQSRPTATEILRRPIIMNCLLKKCETTVDELQMKLRNLRKVADNLERVHRGTTIGSLTGGVIRAVGGITSIVGLCLAPFTMGASLIVTGVGIGVGALGGVTSGASNITNMVNQSSDRKVTRSIIKEFAEKINAVGFWLQEISSLVTINNSGKNCNFKKNNQASAKIGMWPGISIMCIGKFAVQITEVAEVATDALSGLLLAADIFFIAMDAKAIHYIRKKKTGEKISKSGSETGANDSESTSDLITLLPSSQTQDEFSPDTTPVRSEIMKFVRSIRQKADKLQKVLDELKSIISSIPSLEDENEEEGQDME